MAPTGSLTPFVNHSGCFHATFTFVPCLGYIKVAVWDDAGLLGPNQPSVEVVTSYEVFVAPPLLALVPDAQLLAFAG